MKDRCGRERRSALRLAAGIGAKPAYNKSLVIINRSLVLAGAGAVVLDTLRPHPKD
jgi:hypothetical protein